MPPGGLIAHYVLDHLTKFQELSIRIKLSLRPWPSDLAPDLAVCGQQAQLPWRHERKRTYFHCKRIEGTTGPFPARAPKRRFPVECPPSATEGAHVARGALSARTGSRPTTHTRATMTMTTTTTTTTKTTTTTTATSRTRRSSGWSHPPAAEMRNSDFFFIKLFKFFDVIELNLK